MQVCLRVRGDPIRRATATLISLLVSARPRALTSSVWSHEPESGETDAWRRARIEGEWSARKSKELNTAAHTGSSHDLCLKASSPTGGSFPPTPFQPARACCTLASSPAAMAAGKMDSTKWAVECVLLRKAEGAKVRISRTPTPPHLTGRDACVHDDSSKDIFRVLDSVSLIDPLSTSRLDAPTVGAERSRYERRGTAKQTLKR